MVILFKTLHYSTLYCSKSKVQYNNCVPDNLLILKDLKLSKFVHFLIIYNVRFQLYSNNNIVMALGYFIIYLKSLNFIIPRSWVASFSENHVGVKCMSPTLNIPRAKQRNLWIETHDLRLHQPNDRHQFEETFAEF